MSLKNVNPTQLATHNAIDQMFANTKLLKEQWGEAFPKLIYEIQNFSEDHTIRTSDIIAMSYHDNKVAMDLIVKSARLSDEDVNNMIGSTVSKKIGDAVEEDLEIRGVLSELEGLQSQAKYTQTYKDVAKALHSISEGRNTVEQTLQDTKELLFRGSHTLGLSISNTGRSGTKQVSFSKALKPGDEKALRDNFSDPAYWSDLNAEEFLGDLGPDLTTDFLTTATYPMRTGHNQHYNVAYDTKFGRQLVEDKSGEPLELTHEEIFQERDRSYYGLRDMLALDGRRSAGAAALGLYTAQASAILGDNLADQVENNTVIKDSIESIIGQPFEKFTSTLDDLPPEKKHEIIEKMNPTPRNTPGMTKSDLKKMRNYKETITAIGPNYGKVTPEKQKEHDVAVEKLKQEIKKPGSTDGNVQTPLKTPAYNEQVDKLDALNKRGLAILNKLQNRPSAPSEFERLRLSEEYSEIEKQKGFVNSVIDELEGKSNLPKKLSLSQGK